MTIAKETDRPLTLQQIDSNEERMSANDSVSVGSLSDGNTIISSLSSNKIPRNQPNKQDDLTIAKREDVAVFRIRMMAIGVLVACTITVAVLVYYYIRKEEVAQLQQTLKDDTSKLFEAISTTIDSTLGSLDAFVVSIVSFAHYTNATWPFVTVPDFAQRVAKIRSLSKAVVLIQYQVVTEENRAEWEKYSLENALWVNETLELQKRDETFKGVTYDTYSTSPLYGYYALTPNNTGPYYPTWQGYPSVPVFPPFNWDGSDYPSLVYSIDSLQSDNLATLTNVGNLPDPLDPFSEENIAGYISWIQDFLGPDEDPTEPSSDILYPVYKEALEEINLAWQDPVTNSSALDLHLVSILAMTFQWSGFISDVLPSGSDGLILVVENACNQSFTYQINGPKAVYLGPSDLHDERYNDLGFAAELKDLNEFATANRRYTGAALSADACPYTFTTYPSQTMENRFITTEPLIFTMVAVGIFVFTSLVFWMYDIVVERRQQKVMKTAVQSSAIVSSLFPSNVRSRLYGMEEDDSPGAIESQKARLKTFLKTSNKPSPGDITSPHHEKPVGKPIADLFPEATVMFADIAGFTAWSSMREPSQVFTLLESLYGAFDRIASRRGVFKVETIGDSYVAVAGLPEPRVDHAIVMARFARDCRARMTIVTKQLGVTLGPDTEDLSMRFGLHSGPVTAGVLRGEKSRFQLFGDTVNTASRMESTGMRNRIQISQSTADALIEARKQHWITARSIPVDIKGKGKLQTYWVKPHGGTRSVGTSVSFIDEESTPDAVSMEHKLERLTNWNTEVLARLIQQIQFRRLKSNSGRQAGSKHKHDDNILMDMDDPDKMILDEVQEVIELPKFDASMLGSETDHDSVTLDQDVVSQLRDFVLAIANTYNTNPFHNFEHASHVGMSVAKLLSRIVAADDAYDKTTSKAKKDIASSKHDHTYGINSDPLTQFACVFSALIHDVDHQGVPNSQLVKEDDPVALKYQGRSVAEQNSVAIAWEIFTDDKYCTLRNAICETQDEMKRFRQLVINCVMATDIMDKELKLLRNQRWETAFKGKHNGTEADHRMNVNRKATIVIEHLIQASDVAHTMQHWHIYRKWNEVLFMEMCQAYHEGRSEKNPIEYWYKGELGFFDFYIIPLAQKLSECGVFGVSSDEYLNYARRNREEWELKGESIVAEMARKVEFDV